MVEEGSGGGVVVTASTITVAATTTTTTTTAAPTSVVEAPAAADDDAPPSHPADGGERGGSSSSMSRPHVGTVGSVGSGGGRRYGVRAAEVALHRAMSVLRVEVVLLDDSPHVFEIQKRAKGQALLDLVFGHLELLERDYFGLQYRDSRALPGESDRRWLDPLKTVKKQLRLHSKTIDTCELPVLHFRVKFWATDPGRLTEEYTRYHVVLQLRRLLAAGSLPAPGTTSALLASYALQSDFGDYSPAEHGDRRYLKEAELLPSVSPCMMDKLVELHKLHRGQTPADAEYHFLDHAKRLELYGVDLHEARDSSDRELAVGVTSSGLLVIHNGVRMNTFCWAKIIKISFKRKQFMIQLRRENSEPYESVLVFTLPSYRACKCLWKSCVEHHTFFRLHTPRPPPKRQLLALGSKFWYSGRTQHQTVEEARRAIATSPSTRTFVRSPSKQASLATFCTTNGATNNNNAAGGGAPSSSSIGKRGVVVTPSSSSTALPSVVGGSGSLRPRSDSSGGHRVTSLPSTPRLAWAELEKGGRVINGASSSADTTRDVTDVTSRPAHPSPVHLTRRPSTPAHLPSVLSVALSTSTSTLPPPSKDTVSVQQTLLLIKPSPSPSRTPPVLSAPLATQDPDEHDDLLLLRSSSGESKGSSSSSSSTSSSSSAASTSSETSALDVLQTTNGDTSSAVAAVAGGVAEESLEEHGLITIRIRPDTAGRFAGKFGFNVKGGADQDAPVLVSKVTAGSPADTCYPRLNEGDQVLLINGRDVSSMTHAQVVNSIKASRECHSGELVLTVRQNVYEGECADEPEFRYVPESVQQLSQGGTGTPSVPHTPAAAITPQQLKESILLLQNGLESGALVSKFETLYRRKPGLNMDVARLGRNENRNRYRDISPYDTTRVILQDVTIAATPTTTTTTTSSSSASFNDYINASHVIMEIPGSNITNRYIASQGPLHSTCGQFWQMVWEQHCNILVMLTTCIEQGRSKCHQYWPEVNSSSADYGAVSVSCDQHDTKPGFSVRELAVTNRQTGEKRRITHLQYLAWPDHGVPEQSTDFLSFVKEVRQLRAADLGTARPTLVHCSAGIGRTGVLILMETAQCLIEAQQPVYPVELVQRMRDQRAMMIQTSGQFRFVCEAINRVHSEKLVQPLPQYCNR